jgi:elongation factor G
VIVCERLVGETLALGDTLCGVDGGARSDIALESVVVPVPVMGMAIEPRTRDDRDRLSAALSKMVAEDPSLVVRADDETGQTTLSGQGELHLEVALSKLASDHGVNVDASAPRVAYK